MRSGGQLVVDALETLGAKRVFCVPGESYLGVLDALYDSPIATTVCRQEGGAAMMSEAWGKLHNEPGICFVTRGPGATNASAGVHVAAQDSTPILLFIGQVGADCREREAFQELDYSAFLGGMAKWVVEINSTDRITELVARAWSVACSGRPGPVVVVLPETTLHSSAAKAELAAYTIPETHPSNEQIQSIKARLAQANNPIAIIGGSRWDAQAVEHFRAFAERFCLPVAVSFRRQMLFDHTHPNYAGDVGLGINPALKSRIEQADLILMVGTRLSEIASQGYTLLDSPTPKQALIHVHASAEELGRVYRPSLAIHASAKAFASALNSISPDTQPSCSAATAQMHTSYLDWSNLDHAAPEASVMRDIMKHLGSTLPAQAILTNGAGNYASWIHRFWRFSAFGTQLAPTSGSMGYGLPAAIAAKLAHPEKTVVAFAGDGCFQMTCQEFGTAIQAKAAVIVLLIDNGMYGTIRMHQEQHYPSRVSATELVNPDFAQWAAAYGAFTATITEAEQFPAALAQAMQSQSASLLHIKVNPKAITPTKALP